MSLKDNKKFKVNYKVSVNGNVLEEKKSFTLILDDPLNLVGVNILLTEINESNYEKGYKQQLSIPPSLAYGEKIEKLIGSIPNKFLKGGKINDLINIKLSDGTTKRGKIIEIQPEFYVVDCNHPLAGETLDVDIEIVDII